MFFDHDTLEESWTSTFVVSIILGAVIFAVAWGIMYLSNMAGFSF